MLRLKTTLTFCTTLLLMISGCFPNSVIAQSAPDSAPSSRIIITEIKLGGVSAEPDQPKEFVSLFNQTSEDINLDGWSLEYAKAGFSQSECGNASWSDHSYGSQTTLSGNLPAQATLSLEYALTDNTDGALRVTEDAGDTIIQHDLVGWGDGTPCSENDPTERPSTSTTSAESLQRYLECDSSRPLDTDDNSEDFFTSQDTAYGRLGGHPAPDCNDEAGSDCNGVVISEILPNPAGSDSGQEFIELYNSTDKHKSLAGCGLQISGTDKIYWFNQSLDLGANRYAAFYDNQTDLTLPNSAGGTVYLLSDMEEELDDVSYAQDLPDDVSWAWFGGSSWRRTYKLTPGSANSLQTEKACPAGQTRSSDSGRCRGAGSTSSLTPCKPGQARNPATNRCRSILSSVSQLVPCKAGQERNPATNRCRSILSAASNLTPCKPDQFRNPATNRCKKKDSAASNLKPCKPDQERNPDTNRCRKKTGLTQASGANPLEVAGAIPTSSLSAGLVATTVGLALVYGAYEFRHGIRNKFEILSRHFSHRWHSGP